MRSHPLISVCIPTYNSEKIIGPTLTSLKNQTYGNFEVVVSDDASSDKTIKLLRSYGFKSLRIHQNKKNLGYGQNLQELEKMPQGEIIYLLAHDDILSRNALSLTVGAFVRDAKVGVVTRPYYWFDTDPNLPIRHIPPIDDHKTVFIDVVRTPEKIIPIIESVGQLSGLAYRRDLFTHFHHEVFPAHIYPFMEILKKAKCAFLPTYTVAVGTLNSQTRSKPAIYEISPTLSWMKMFDTVFAGNRYKRIREIAKDHMGQNYLGLVQLKNFADKDRILRREILTMLKERPRNALSMKFWFFSLGTLLTPRTVLIWLVDHYKRNFLSKQIGNIDKI